MDRYILGIDLGAELLREQKRDNDLVKLAWTKKSLFSSQATQQKSIVCPAQTTLDKLDLALEHVETSFPRSPEDIFIALDSKDVLFYPLNLPFDKGPKMQDIMRFELENVLPLPVDHYAWDFCLLDKKDAVNHFLAALAPRDLIQAIFQKIHQKGLHLSGISADLPLLNILAKTLDKENNFLVLQAGRYKTNLVWQINKRPLTLRSLGIGLKDIFPPDCPEDPPGPNIPAPVLLARRELISQIKLSLAASQQAILPEKCLLLTTHRPPAGLKDILEPALGIPVVQLEQAAGSPAPQPASIASVLVANAHPGNIISRQTGGLKKSRTWLDLSLALRQGRTGASRVQNWIRQLALSLICIALAWGISSAFRLHLKQQELHDLETQTEQVFREIVPEAPNHLRPMQYTSVARNRLQGMQTKLNGPAQKIMPTTSQVLTILSRALPRGMQITLLNLSNGQIRLMGLAKDYKNIDLFKKELEKTSGIKQVKIIGANLDQSKGQVTFSMDISTTGL